VAGDEEVDSQLDRAGRCAHDGLTRTHPAERRVAHLDVDRDGVKLDAEGVEGRDALGVRVGQGAGVGAAAHARQRAVNLSGG